MRKSLRVCGRNCAIAKRNAHTKPNIRHIAKVLAELPPECVVKVDRFISDLAEKERIHEAFVEETLAAEKEPVLRFETAEDAFNAIMNETRNAIPKVVYEKSSKTYRCES
jgi:rubrerythrin